MQHTSFKAWCDFQAKHHSLVGTVGLALHGEVAADHTGRRTSNYRYNYINVFMCITCRKGMMPSKTRKSILCNVSNLMQVIYLLVQLQQHGGYQRSKILQLPSFQPKERQKCEIYIVVLGIECFYMKHNSQFIKISPRCQILNQILFMQGCQIFMQDYYYY